MKYDQRFFNSLETGGGATLNEAIGKGVINVEGLPVFVDAKGPFGSSTSDSQLATPLLEKYAQAHDVRSGIVK